MKKEFKRFDMTIPPKRIKWYLRPVRDILCIGGIKKHKPKVTYIGTENIKGPFLLLCNHNAFLDFKVASTLLGKNDANYVVAIDGYLNREGLLRNVGCICKRKFTSDIILPRQLKRVINMGNVAVLYPEARYSLCGTTAVLPESLGRLCKFLDVPVVTLICHGHHVNSPFWDTSHERGVCPTEATYKLLYSREQVKSLSVDELNAGIVNEFQYDDFKWQKDNQVKIAEENRADGLHKVLYKCPICEKEHRMGTEGTKLFCKECGKEWNMTEYGELEGIGFETPFTHIPNWYEWEREKVKEEVLNGTYSSGELAITVDSLPKNKFIRLGKGTLLHDTNGFHVKGTDVDGDPFEMEKEVSSMYSCHIEYRYLFKHGDCIDLNTLKDTWYIYPEGEDFSVTKMALATEELYKKMKLDKGELLQEGLL